MATDGLSTIASQCCRQTWSSHAKCHSYLAALLAAGLLGAAAQLRIVYRACASCHDAARPSQARCCAPAQSFDKLTIKSTCPDGCIACQGVVSDDEYMQDQPEILDTSHAPASPTARWLLLLLLLLRLLLSRVSACCPFRHHALDLQNALHDVQCLLLLGRWAFC